MILSQCLNLKRLLRSLFIRYYSSESLVTKGLRANFGLFAEMGAKPQTEGKTEKAIDLRLGRGTRVENNQPIR